MGFSAYKRKRKYLPLTPSCRDRKFFAPGTEWTDSWIVTLSFENINASPQEQNKPGQVPSLRLKDV